MKLPDVGDGWHRVPGYAEAPLRLVSGDVVCDQPEEWSQRPRLAAGSRTRQLSDRLVVAAQIAARNGSTRSRSADRVGWDETYLGSREEGADGRGVQHKALILVAAQADGSGIGRIRMRVIQHPSAANIHPFVEDCIEPGSTVHTDAWQGYAGLAKKGYDHEVTSVQTTKRSL